MDVAVWVLIIAFAVAAVALVVGLWLSTQRRRTEKLQQKFGPEYDRAVGDYGGRSEAEERLREREARVARLKLRPLSKEERNRYAVQWDEAQAQFVDDPKAAISNGQRLVEAVMSARGFPLGDFDQRAEDISVEHPNVVTNFRAAREIAEANDRGEADTEQLRQAMVHYRSLFTDLMNTADSQVVPERQERETTDRPAGRIDTRRQAPRSR